MNQARSLSPVPWKRMLQWGLLLLVFGLFLALALIHLEDQVIMAYDEARHGVSGYEMIRNNDYLVNTYQGEPDHWNLKPPLSFWLIAMNFKLFGYTCTAFRLHSVLATLGTLAAIALWSKKRYGALASLLLALVFVANPHVYNLNFARTGDADALQALFSTVCMLCMLRSKENLRWLYASALCFALSFLAKSFHGLILPLVCFLYMLFTGQWKRLRWRNVGMLLAIGLAPIAAWAAARYARDGLAFLGQMFQTDVMDRVISGGRPWYYFLQRWCENPVIIASALIGMVYLLGKIIQKKKFNHTETGVLLWILVPLTVYSFSSFKLTSYVIPCEIGMELAAGLIVCQWAKGCRVPLLKAAGCALLAVGLALQIGANWQAVLGKDNKGSFQTNIIEMFDRDMDGGKRVYMQSVDGKGEWQPNDMLRALLSGDVVCLNGGSAAFEKDEEEAYLFIEKRCLTNELLEYYPVYAETGLFSLLGN